MKYAIFGIAIVVIGISLAMVFNKTKTTNTSSAGDTGGILGAVINALSPVPKVKTA